MSAISITGECEHSGNTNGAYIIETTVQTLYNNSMESDFSGVILNN